MKKLLIILLALLVLALPALAASPVQPGEPLEGLYVWPEGSSEADALYIYRYRYPQVTGDEELAMHINNTYSYAVEDALGFEVPMLASGMQAGDPQKVVDIDYRITCLNEEYLSILIIKRVTVAGSVTEVYSGHVFAPTGSGAGRITNLPVLLGLLDAEETDDWLMTRQTNKADALVRTLVWNRISRSLTSPSDTDPRFYDDLTREELEAGFYPEEDFFLTEDGEPCFYFQPGAIAPEEDGLVTFTITRWELEDEM